MTKILRQKVQEAFILVLSQPDAQEWLDQVGEVLSHDHVQKRLDADEQMLLSGMLAMTECSLRAMDEPNPREYTEDGDEIFYVETVVRGSDNAELSRRRLVVTPSRPGWGGSFKAVRTANDHARELQDFFEALGVVRALTRAWQGRVSL